MRRRIRAAFAILLAGAAAPAMAQLSQAQKEAAAAAADQAALEAERAAAAARRASDEAAAAARAARSAATAARTALGLPASAPAPALTEATPEPLPVEENLPVIRPTATAASAAAAAEPANQQREFREALGASVANGPNDASLKSALSPDLQLLASSEEKVASLSVSADVSGQPRPGVLAHDQLTLTATSKLDDDGEAQIVGLKGFPNGTGVKLSYTHFGSRVNLTGREKDAVRVARENCLRRTATAEAAKCNPYDHPTGVSEFVLEYNKQGLRPLLDEVLPGPVWFYGIEFAGNQAAYKYLDQASFTMQKKRRFGYGGTLFGGAIFAGGRTSLTGSFTYQREYEEQDPITLCQPVTGTIQTQCITAAGGPPSRGTESIVSVEVRHAFDAGVGLFPTLAIAPEISADVENDAYSLDFPIYFAGEAAGKLRAGIRGVYLNEPGEDGERKDSFTLGLFVGVPFSLFR